jgi:hypothetical protein
MSEWQPIETAPKDGFGKGIFTGTKGPMVLVTDGTGPYIAFWNGRSWDDGDYHDDLGEMTHWMPLPEPPISDLGISAIEAERAGE